VLFAETGAERMGVRPAESGCSLTVIGPPQAAFNAKIGTGFVLRQPRAAPTGVSILGVAIRPRSRERRVAPGEFISIYGNAWGRP